jgi:uncharacterized repeat protein (TIGR02543 family)
MKRYIVILMICAMVLCLCPSAASAADFTITADGTYDISAYGNNSVIEINGGLEVTLVGDPGTTYTNIQIICGPKADLTLENVHIVNNQNAHILSFSGNETNKLRLQGDTVVENGGSYAAVYVAAKSVLHLSGDSARTYPNMPILCGPGVKLTLQCIHIENHNNTHALSFFGNKNQPNVLETIMEARIESSGEYGSIYVADGTDLTINGESGIMPYANMQIICDPRVRLTLQNVQIDNRNLSDTRAVSFSGNGNILTLEDSVLLMCDADSAGVQVGDKAVLTIKGDSSRTYGMQIRCEPGVKLTLNNARIDNGGNAHALSFSGDDNTLNLIGDIMVKSGSDRAGMKVGSGGKLTIYGDPDKEYRDTHILCEPGVTLRLRDVYIFRDEVHDHILSFSGDDNTLLLEGDTGLKSDFDFEGFAGVHAADGASLTIIGQSDNACKHITVACEPGVDLTLRDVHIDNSDHQHNTAALSFAGDGTHPSALTLKGDNVLKSSHNEYAGVRVGNTADLTIQGNGTLTVVGGDTGIGCDNGSGVTITGGTVTATGGRHAGIGGGGNSENIHIMITGGTVTATGGEDGAGIDSGDGGSVTITGGTVTATGGEKGAGIDGGDGGSVTIEGGTITATGGEDCAGIGSGRNGSIMIAGGTVGATGGMNGAGIGGGGFSENIRIMITGGTVTAAGGKNGAGIGGGGDSYGTSITIESGTVTATGGQYGAGIGGGGHSINGAIAIAGGRVTTVGGEDSAGIGGGRDAEGSDITIRGGAVTATGMGCGAGIGGGDSSKYIGITLQGGVVCAEGGASARHDIGDGRSGNQGTLNISGTAAVFPRTDRCISPTAPSHTHYGLTPVTRGRLFGIALPAGWTQSGVYIIPVTLTYDGKASDTVTQHIGTTIAVANRRRSGYAFTGWNTRKNGGGAVYKASETFTFAKDTTLYAQWAKLYTLTYAANSGSGTGPSSVTKQRGSRIPVADAGGLSWTGYVFAGWNTAASGSGTAYKPGDRLTLLRNTTLYAMWDAEPDAAPTPTVSATPIAAAAPSPTPAPTAEPTPSPTPEPVERISPSPAPTETSIPIAAKVASRDDDSGTVVIEIEVSTLPAGTAALQAPDGTTYPLDGSDTIRIKTDGDSGTIELIALDEEGVPLGTCTVLVSQETLPRDTHPVSAWLWILGGIVIIGGIGATGYFLWRKGKAVS